MDGIRFVSYVGKDRFVVASADEVICCRVNESAVEEVCRAPQEGRSFPLLAIRQHAETAFHLELGPEEYTLQLLARDGLYAASSTGVTRIHIRVCAMRAIVCDDVFLAMEIGPRVQVYNARERIASFVMSSASTDGTGFDALCPSRGDGADEVLLLTVIEKGVLDRFSWNCSETVESISLPFGVEQDENELSGHAAMH